VALLDQVAEPSHEYHFACLMNLGIAATSSD
jgi:hypothetical protein